MDRRNRLKMDKGKKFLRNFNLLERDYTALQGCVEDMGRYLKEIMWRVSTCKQIAPDGIVSAQQAQEIAKQTKRDMQNFDSSLDAAFRIRLNRNLTFVPDFDEEKFDEVLAKQVKIELEDECIFVKTPHLFNRNQHAICNGRTDYFSFFAPIVRRKMAALRHKLPLMHEKNITILSVFPSSADILPDADNLDSKLIVDAITNELPGGDAGVCCSFFLAVYKSDLLPPGAYFTVSPGFAAIPDFQDNFRALLRHFPAED